MNDFQKRQRLLAIVTTLAILGGLALAILGESNRPVIEKTPFEIIIGILAFFAILVPMALYWILPNTAWGKKRLTMKESLYSFSFSMGIALGLFGLAATITHSQTVIRSHLFELLFALFGLNYVFWAMVMKSQKTTDVSRILDEKQIRNLVESAAGTFMLVTCIMFVMYFISYHGVLIFEEKVWFLFYFFLSMVIFSALNIHAFKRN